MISDEGGTRSLYEIRDLPVFQNCTFASKQEAQRCPTGDVTLVQDLATGLVFNRTFDPTLMTYGPDYQNEQALSEAFRDHLDDVTAIVDRNFRGKSLIEVGCGKGYFLELLLARGFEIIGMDPAYEGTNPRVVKQYFSRGSGRRAAAIILRHVLEHVQNPTAFLAAIREANGGSGQIYIEVPCFDWICRRRAWFDIFYEHVNYFRMDDLHRMFGVIHDEGHFFGGQYMYVVADLSSLRAPLAKPADAVRFPEDFVRRLEQHAAFIRTTSGRAAAIWGGSSKGVIFGLMMERAGARIDLVIDINPAKQSRYLPTTGLRVFSPDEAMKNLAPSANIFVMNENYLDEIRALTKGRFNCLPADDPSGVTSAQP